MVANLKIRRDTCENWYNNNPILSSDEMGYDITHNRIKIGDGIHSWNDIDYLDRKYNDAEIKSILANIIEINLPQKANADDVYSKVEIHNMNLVSEDELIAKNYANKDEVRTEFLTRCEADSLATRKEVAAHDFEIVKMMDEKKANKSETYSKIEVDKKLAEIEFCCHHPHHKPALPPCQHYNMPSYINPLHKCDCECEDKPALPPCDDKCECTEKLFASVYVKGEVDALLEKKADQRFVNMALSTKADISYVDAKLENEYYSITDIDNIIRQLTGEDITSFVTKDELQKLTDNLESNYLTAEDVENLIKTITGVDVSVFASKDELNTLTETVDKKADKEIVEQALELKADKNDLKEMVSYKPFANDRKTIELPNHWTISGLNIDGVGYNLAMVSKWNVADFGSSGIHMNLNTADVVTINDDKVVATITDIEDAIEPKANKEDIAKQFENVYTKEETDALNENIKNVANAAKVQSSDISNDLATNYLTKEQVEVNFKHLEDEIANVGSALTKLIIALENKGIIDKGTIIVSNVYK